MTKPLVLSKLMAALILAVTFLAALGSDPAAAAPPEECVGPSPRDAPVKALNLYNNSSIPMYVVLETAKQNLLDADGLPSDRWLQAEFNPTPGRYASTYLYRAYVNP